MGPFPTALRQLKFLVVGIDYFTKWVEAEPLATIIEKNIQIGRASCRERVSPYV